MDGVDDEADRPHAAGENYFSAVVRLFPSSSARPRPSVTVKLGGAGVRFGDLCLQFALPTWTQSLHKDAIHHPYDPNFEA